MAITIHHPTLRIILLVIIFGCVTSNSLQSLAQENPYQETALREKRQTTVLALFTDIGIFLGSVLVFVANLLRLVGALLLGITAQLGLLVGLGLLLNNIVDLVAAVVLSLSGKKRRDLTNLRFVRAITSDEVTQKLNDGKTAASNLSGLSGALGQLDVTAQLNSLKTKADALNKKLPLAKTTPATIQIELTQIVNLQDTIAVRVLKAVTDLNIALTSNCPIIGAGFVAPVTFISGLGTSLAVTVPGTLLTQLLSILEKAAQGETTLNDNFSKTVKNLNSISKTVSDHLASCTKQLGGAIARTIGSSSSGSG